MSGPRYFGFVEHGAAGAFDYLEGTYSSMRSVTLKHSPGFVASLIQKSEEIAGPWIGQAQKLSHSALLLADSSVQSSINVAHSAVTSTRSAADRVVGAERIKSVEKLSLDARLAFGDALVSAKEAMLQAREDGVVETTRKVYSSIYERVTALPGQVYTRASGAVQLTATKVQERLHAVFETNTAKNISAKSHGAAQAFADRYGALHDELVSMPSYANVHFLAISSWDWLTSQPIVAGPAEKIYTTAYPRVKGYVDPAVTKAEPYVRALGSHLEPKAKPTIQMNGAPAGDVSPASS